jgi:surface antigen
MFAPMKVTLAALAMGLGLFAMGCESSGSGDAAKHDHSAMTTADEQAVTCDKCKVTWRKAPQTDKGRIVAYRTTKSHECPDCRSAVENFFSTGKLQHTCTTCGENAMEVCKTH